VKVRVVGRGIMKEVGARTPPESRSVGPTPIFFAALRASGSVRVGRPEGVGNAADRDREAVGQRRLRPL